MDAVREQIMNDHSGPGSQGGYTCTTMLKKLYLTLLRPSMWSGRVLGPLLDCVHAIVHNLLELIIH